MSTWPIGFSLLKSGHVALLHHLPVPVTVWPYVQLRKVPGMKRTCLKCRYIITHSKWHKNVWLLPTMTTRRTPNSAKAIACEKMSRWSLPGFLQQNSVDESFILLVRLGGRIFNDHTVDEEHLWKVSHTGLRTLCHWWIYWDITQPMILYVNNT